MPSRLVFPRKHETPFRRKSLTGGRATRAALIIKGFFLIQLARPAGMNWCLAKVGPRSPSLRTGLNLHHQLARVGRVRVGRVRVGLYSWLCVGVVERGTRQIKRGGEGGRLGGDFRAAVDLILCTTA